MLPAYSLAEPSEALTRRTRERRALLQRLTAEIKEVSRSRPYVALSTASATFNALLAQSSEDERTQLHALVSRLLAVAEVVPLAGAVMVSALSVESALDLSPQDAIVFASVEAHAASAGPGRKLFVTKNRSDFFKPVIIERLGKAGCKLVTSFAAAAGYIESQTRTAG